MLTTAAPPRNVPRVVLVVHRGHGVVGDARVDAAPVRVHGGFQRHVVLHIPWTRRKGRDAAGVCIVSHPKYLVNQLYKPPQLVRFSVVKKK